MIRPAKPQDIQAMVLLLQHLLSLEADFYFDEECQARGLTRLLDAPNAIALIAETRGTIAGMVMEQSLVSTTEGTYAFIVEDLVISPNGQGQGLGTELLRAIEDFAKKKEITRIQLLADRNNKPALQFNKKHNWQQTELICLRKRF